MSLRTHLYDQPDFHEKYTTKLPASHVYYCAFCDAAKSIRVNARDFVYDGTEATKRKR